MFNGALDRTFATKIYLCLMILYMDTKMIMGIAGTFSCVFPESSASSITNEEGTRQSLPGWEARAPRNFVRV
jgi:hypothetical protein